MREQDECGGRAQILAFRQAGLDGAALSRQFLDFSQTKINLCCALEGLADGLCSGTDFGRAEMVLKEAGTLVSRAHRFEETEVFPVLRQYFFVDKTLMAALARLEQEHIEDAEFARELEDACVAMIAGGAAVDDNTFGYMLRGFFASLRRHVAFECEYVVPFLKRI